MKQMDEDESPSTPGLVPVYTEIKMDPNSRPTSHINETRESLNKLDNGELELTENKSTILHLVSEFGDTDYAKDILKRHPSLIDNRNIEGETPFYVAASEGHKDMLEILIIYANSDKIEELATRSTDKDTALHIAIKKNHPGVVFWLVKRIPQLANHVNDLNESPLYLAVNKNFYDIVEQILKECKEKAYDGPDGKTALHAAVMVYLARPDDPDDVKSDRCIRSLLQANIGLLKIQDKDGWTPLHYAAKIGRTRMILYLLRERRTDYTGNQMTTTYDIITSAFGITEYKKGRNMLHVAIEYKRIETTKIVFGDESLISLINQKDSNGDTPLHLLMASNLVMTGIMMDGRFPFDVCNDENHTPLDMVFSEEKREILKEAMAKLAGERGKARRRLWEDLVEEAKEREKEKQKKKRVFGKIGDNVVLVVTLIATATFAAAFTVPGGFDGNEGLDQGMPILLRKAAYKAFVVANALAFSCSCTVLFGHIRLQLDEAGEEEKDGSMSINIISLQYLLTGIAMVAMAIAFVTGTYVILTPSLGFAIPVCAMCLCIMVPLSIFPRNRLGFATAILRKLT